MYCSFADISKSQFIMSHIIRRRSTDSVNSVDQQSFLDVELKSSQRLLHHTDIKGEVDRYEQFLKERRACDLYRIILTINPYCTNVLFNTLTEINYKEGTEDCHTVKDNVKESVSGVMGNVTPNRIDMVSNTEYSQFKYGYTYHPGYDIFDNHILRSNVFRLVNKPETYGNADFNTLADTLRWSNGTIVKIRPHIISGDDIVLKNETEQHLYTYDDILSMSDGSSINANLTEENGWFGFVNNSTITSKEGKKNKDEYEWNDLGISHVLNDNKNCEFVDMYPDRTLFSFNPKFNEARHRLEHNWDIVLTYPADKVGDHGIIQFSTPEYKNIHGLRVMSVEKMTNHSGADMLLFRTYTRHGLKRGDTVALYMSEVRDGTFERYEKTFKVSNVGDMQNENKEYFFQLTDMDVYLSQDDNLDKEGVTDDEINLFFYKESSTTSGTPDFGNPKKFFFVRKSVNGVECDYYFRIFRKIPNRRWASKQLDADTANDATAFNTFVSENCSEPSGFMSDFGREHYQLAFQSTIYNDNSTQVTFTDNVDLSELVDHRGRPLTEIYATLIKTNRGHEEWYEDGNFADEKVEYSHCFGPVDSGIEMLSLRGDDTDNRLLYGDASLLCRRNASGYNSEPSVYENDITSDKITGDGFYGDLVEYSPSETQETVLDVMSHRFNTVQRELPLSCHYFETTNSEGTGNFIYVHEISADDFDRDDFNVEKTHVKQDEYKTGYDVLNRPEGYLYTPHYRMTVRQFGEVVQAGHNEITVTKAEPAQADGIFVRITSALPHHLVKGDIVLVCDDDHFVDKTENTRIRFEFVVTYIEGRNKFLIVPKFSISSKAASPWVDFNNKWKEAYDGKAGEINWITLCLAIMNTERKNTDSIRLKIRAKNTEIPRYADEVQPNVFLWRPVLRIGDMGADGIPDYPFTNGALYIHKDIDFFLRRQDPHGMNGLYCKDAWPNDVPGNNEPESNYDYKDERDILC